MCWAMTEPPREPFFGYNARPWLIQMAFVVFCIVVLLPLAITYLKPQSDSVVNSFFDGLCSTMGWCTPEAELRLRESAHQQ